MSAIEHSSSPPAGLGSPAFRPSDCPVGARGPNGRARPAVRGHGGVCPVLALVMVASNPRGPPVAVSPVLGSIRADTGMSAAAAC